MLGRVSPMSADLMADASGVPASCSTQPDRSEHLIDVSHGQHVGSQHRRVVGELLASTGLRQHRTTDRTRGGTRDVLRQRGADMHEQVRRTGLDAPLVPPPDSTSPGELVMADTSLRDVICRTAEDPTREQMHECHLARTGNHPWIHASTLCPTPGGQRLDAAIMRNVEVESTSPIRFGRPGPVLCPHGDGSRCRSTQPRFRGSERALESGHHCVLCVRVGRHRRFQHGAGLVVGVLPHQ